MSQRLIYHIVEENPLVRASISNEEVALVQRLVAGSPSFSGTIMDGKSSKGGAGDIKSPLTRDWMFQIVCNQLNSIDVDKFDYLMRDSHYLGPFFVGGVHDFSRIMASARVIDNEICYHEKTKHELFQLFQMRYAMYQMVYTHRVSHAVDQMLYDVYDAADSVYKFSANLRDPSKFCSMTDWILLRVEHSRNPALKSARSLVQKIRQRELYSCVGEILLSREVWKSVERMKASSFIVSDSTSTLECSDVRLETILLHHPKCTTKPLQHVRFYSSKNRDRSFILEREQISLLLPMQLEEYKLRVFVTSSQKQSAAEACFQTVMGQWMQKKNKTDGGGGNDKLEDPQQLNSAEKAHSVPQVDGMVSDASSSFSDDANTDGRYEKINLDSIKPPSIPEPRSANVTTPPSNECIIF
jgi:HD superfamily phosphohydrolase